MEEFEGLDLQAVEQDLDSAVTDSDGNARVILDVLDGTTGAEEWLELVATGAILVLNVEGDLNELASGFARDVREAGGELMHFRGFLVVTPPDVEIDSDRLD